jgi:HK97 family phage major capsid protein
MRTLLADGRHAAGLEDLLNELEGDVSNLTDHGPSRYVGVDADADYAKQVAERGAAWGTKSYSAKTAPGTRFGGGSGDQSLARAIVDVAQHRTDHMQPTYSAKAALGELVDTAGGFLLTPEISQQVMLLIRNRLAVLKMPVTHVQPRSKSYLLPGIASGASAAWITENAPIPASVESFQIQGTMVPRPLGSLVAISNRLLADATADNPSSAGSAEEVIQADVANLMAVTFDGGLLAGASGGPQPKGILSYTGTTPLPAGTIAANGSSPSYGILTAIVGALQQQSMPFTSPGWIFAGRTLQSLMSLVNSYGEPLLLGKPGLLEVDPAGSTGKLLGYPFACTNAVPTNQSFGTANNASTIIFSSDFSELFVGDWQLFAIDSSNEAAYTPDGGTSWVSSFQNQQTLIRATLWADMAIRRPAAFVLAQGILP